MFVTSTTGLVLGLSFGGLATFSKPPPVPANSRLNRFIPTWLALRLPQAFAPAFTTFLFGIMTGATIVLFYVQFGQRTWMREVLTVSVSFLVGAIVWCLTDRCRYPARRWYHWTILSWWFVLSVAIGLITTLTIDTQRRRMAIPHVGMYSTSITAQWLPRHIRQGYRSFIQSVDDWTKAAYVASLTFGLESSDSDIVYAKGFPFVSSLAFEEGSQVSDEGMRQLPLRRLLFFRCGPQTRLTNLSAQQLDVSRLISLELEGANFTDQALTGLSQAPRLTYLNLRGANVTSAGLKHLDTTAPLWMIDLSHTQVDDEILATLARIRSLSELRLAGTNITGSGLKHLRGRSLNLDLSKTPLDPAYLADLLAPEGAEPLFHSVFVHSLSLREVSLPPEAFTVLAKLTSLNRLDIIGSQVSSSSLEALGRLSLRRLAINGDQLQPELLSLLKSKPDLLLAYDGEQMNLHEIRNHLTGLLNVPTVTLSGSGTGATMKMSVLIKNLRVGLEEMQLLEEIGESVDIELKHALLPDGTREDVPNMLNLFIRFRNGRGNP